MVETGLVGDSILSRAAYGGGYGEGYGRGFASDASNAVRIKGSEKLSAQAHAFNRDAAHNDHDSISQQISDNADRNRDLARAQGDNAAVIANRDFQTQVGFQISGQIARGEDNVNAQFNQIQRELAATAREAAKCCCEAKVLALTNQAETAARLATIEANQDCASKVADAVANAEQSAMLKLLLSERGGHHSGN